MSISIVVTHFIFSATDKLCPQCGNYLVKNLDGDVKCSQETNCTFKSKWEDVVSSEAKK